MVIFAQSHKKQEMDPIHDISAQLAEYKHSFVRHHEFLAYRFLDMPHFFYITFKIDLKFTITQSDNSAAFAWEADV